MRFDFQCAAPDCGHVWEQVARSEERVGVCPECQSAADRLFSVTANLQIPTSFRYTRGWHLPPKDHPSWETTAKEGSTRAKPRRDVGKELKAEFQKAGLYQGR